MNNRSIITKYPAIATEPSAMEHIYICKWKIKNENENGNENWHERVTDCVNVFGLLFIFFVAFHRRPILQKCWCKNEVVIYMRFCNSFRGVFLRMPNAARDSMVIRWVRCATHCGNVTAIVNVGRTCCNRTVYIARSARSFCQVKCFVYDKWYVLQIHSINIFLYCFF